MKINKIFDSVDSDLDIKKLFVNSRDIVEDGMFFCIKGLVHDSHNYIDEAIQNGAVAIVHELDFDEEIEKYKDILFIKVDDSRSALSKAAELFYGNPSSKLRVCGITGTNGKTSSSYIIYQLLSHFEKTAYNGTIGSIIDGKKIEYKHLTTPASIDLVEIFKEAVDSGAKSMTIEVSSHAIDMKRADAINYDMAVFTNLTPDHLDYHGDMETYRDVKCELFRKLDENGIAIVNIDDPSAKYFMKAATKAKVLTFGKSKDADYRFEDLKLEALGSKFTMVHKDIRYKIKTNLISEANVYNILTAVAVVHQSGIEINRIIPLLENLKLDIGRFQTIPSSKYTVIVDYAHTPDGYAKVFDYVEVVKTAKTKVISVFGASGRRFIDKRAEAGRIASEHSDIIILTEENTRGENPLDIANDIAKGIRKGCETIFEMDREVAIRTAFEKADKGDIILILGKAIYDYLDNGKEFKHWAGDHVIAEKYAEL